MSTRPLRSPRAISRRQGTKTLAIATAAIAALGACSSSGAGSSSAAAGPSSPATVALNTNTAAIPDSRVDLSHCQMPEPIDLLLEIDSAVFGSVDRVSVHFTPCTLDQPTPIPIIYLLHGAGADETQWPDVDIFTAADAAVMNGTMPPSILVAPDAADAYACSDCADDLLAHILDEIEPAIARTAPVDPDHRAIGGISRGGGLALQVAGLAPEQFVAVGAHSSVSAPDEALTSIAAAGLPVRFDVGDDDGLADASDSMATLIDTKGGQADVVVAPGRHDRSYWRSQADSYIAFYSPQLR